MVVTSASGPASGGEASAGLGEVKSPPAVLPPMKLPVSVEGARSQGGVVSAAT